MVVGTYGLNKRLAFTQSYVKELGVTDFLLIFPQFAWLKK